VPPLGKQSGEHQRVGRDSQQCRSRSVGTIRQARKLTQLTDAERGCPDHGETENKCRGSRKHRPAVRSQQRGQEQAERKHGAPPVVRRRAEGDCAHRGQRCKRQRAFGQLPSLGQVAAQAGKPDKQRRHHDDAQSIGGEPVQPSGQERCARAVEEDEAGRRHGSRDCRADACGRKEPEHAAQAIQPEVLAEPLLDQPGDE